MKVHNLIEDLVEDLMDATLKNIPNTCDCNQCRSDIAAIVLNKIPPKYVATSEGYLYSKADKVFSHQSQTDMVKLIAEAQRIVSSNPRHDKEN